MAYRQLCAVAFAVIGLSVACGGNTLGSAGDPPTSSDVPPSSSDDTPSGSEDSPPSNPDTPPDSADDTPPGGSDTPPSGGRLQQLCEDACEVLEAIANCEGEDPDPMAQEICANNGCAAAVDPGQPIPCIDQIEGLFQCFARLPDVCMPSQEQAQQCLDEVEDFSDCADDQEPPVEQPNPAEMCTMGGGCICPTDCASCLCANPGANAQVCTEICTIDQNM